MDRTHIPELPSALDLVQAVIEAGGARLEGTCPRYPDAYIEYWGRVYLNNAGLRTQGVLFSTFLAYPDEIMRAFAFDVVPRTQALFPAQARMARLMEGGEREAEIDAQIKALERMLARKHMRVSNGACVEPMHHHMHPRTSRYPRLREVKTS